MKWSCSLHARLLKLTLQSDHPSIHEFTFGGGVPETLCCEASMMTVSKMMSVPLERIWANNNICLPRKYSFLVNHFSPWSLKSIVCHSCFYLSRLLFFSNCFMMLQYHSVWRRSQPSIFSPWVSDKHSELHVANTWPGSRDVETRNKFLFQRLADLAEHNSLLHPKKRLALVED